MYAGGAVTILVSAARSGADCVHAGSVGTGRYGDLIRQVLSGAGVTISSPPVADADTGVCLVFVEPTGERTFITIQGAERHITEASLATSCPVAGDMVAVSGYTLQGPTCAPLMAWLSGLPRGVEVVLDPGEAFAELDDAAQQAALDLTTIWTSNADEARVLTGDPDMMTSPIKVAALLPEGALVIVRDGPAGCAVCADGVTTVVPGFPQTPIDTNGAGDTHTGVMMAEMLAGMAPVDAARRANAAGALKVTQRGFDTLPTRAQIDKFLDRQNAGE